MLFKRKNKDIFKVGMLVRNDAGEEGKVVCIDEYGNVYVEVQRENSDRPFVLVYSGKPEEMKKRLMIIGE